VVLDDAGSRRWSRSAARSRPRTSTGLRSAVSRTRTSTRSCPTRSWEAMRAALPAWKAAAGSSNPSACADHRHDVGLMGPVSGRSIGHVAGMLMAPEAAALSWRNCGGNLRPGRAAGPARWPRPTAGTGHMPASKTDMHPRRFFVSIAAERRRPEPPTPVKEPITQRHRKESLHVPDRRLGALGRRVDHCRERAQIIWFCVRRAGRLMTFTAARSAGGLAGGGGKGDSEGATLPNLAVWKIRATPRGAVSGAPGAVLRLGRYR
jgi:hypothetical protein